MRAVPRLAAAHRRGREDDRPSDDRRVVRAAVRLVVGDLPSRRTCNRAGSPTSRSTTSRSRSAGRPRSNVRHCVRCAAWWWPAIPEPPTRRCSTVPDADGCGAPLRDALIAQAAPVVAALEQWSGFAPRGTWGQLTSAWAAQFTSIAEPRDDQRGLAHRARRVLRRGRIVARCGRGWPGVCACAGEAARPSAVTTIANTSFDMRSPIRLAEAVQQPGATSRS